MVSKKKVNILTKPLIFDTDCLSAFLWVNQQSLLVQLYPGQIVIPSEVLTELSFPGIAHLKARINLMIINKDVKLASIQTGRAVLNSTMRLLLTAGQRLAPEKTVCDLQQSVKYYEE